MTDPRFMRLALRLAARNLGRTSPNPAVGAVVVRDGEVVGRGSHPGPGSPHAEVFALRQAGERGRGADLYVTLEPCCHWGRTPPCTEAIVAAGIARVVAAAPDPNPLVAGKGIQALERAGMAVEVGLLEAQARELNRGYFKLVETGRPLFSLKSALSLDGKIATGGGESKWITGEESRALVHRLRAGHDAVLTGVGTVLADDPHLTARRPDGRVSHQGRPLRVVVDSRGRTPVSARALDGTAPTIIATTALAPSERISALERAGAEVWALPERAGRVDLEALADRLGQRGAAAVLVEAGGDLAAGLLAAGLVDRVYFFLAPLVIGGKHAPGPVGGEGAAKLAEAWRIGKMRCRKVGADLLIEGEVG